MLPHPIKNTLDQINHQEGLRELFRLLAEQPMGEIARFYPVEAPPAQGREAVLT